MKATADHKLLTEKGWKEVLELGTEDRLVLQKAGSFGTLHVDKEVAMMLGKACKKEVPSSVFSMDKEGVRNFLSALFSADGSVQGSKEKGISIRLASI